MEMSLICINNELASETHFHMNSLGQRLVLTPGNSEMDWIITI